MSHIISLKEAVAMTKRFRENREQILTSTQQNKGLLPLSETFDRSAVEILLNKPGCTAIRIYYGMDEAFNLHAILVASDAGNRDIIPSPDMPDSDEGDVFEKGIRCPPLCPGDSSLNY